MGELTKPACNLLDRKDTTRIKGKGEKGKKEREEAGIPDTPVQTWKMSDYKRWPSLYVTRFVVQLVLHPGLPVITSFNDHFLPK